MILYADILFIINFSMDFLALFLTSMIMHRKIHKVRILIAAAIGGIYSIFEIVVNINSILSIIITIIISIVICLISFKEKKFKGFAAMYLIFWGVSASIGGLMSLLYTFLNKILYDFIKDFNAVESEIYDGARFFIIASIAIITAIVFSRIFKGREEIKEIEFEVILNSKSYKLKGLCDTGNMLIEPITGKKVILVSQNSEIGKEIEEYPDYKKRYIPYSAVKETGFIKGIVPKNIIINKKEITAVVATVNNEDFGGYEALIPSSLV